MKSGDQYFISKPFEQSRWVQDPREIWAQASITWDQLERALVVPYSILDFLHEKLRGNKFPMPDYDASDAARAAKFVEDLN
jgi:hypothetical protein